MTIRAELDELAKAVITRARADAAPLDVMVDALKVCATYYAICEKVKAKSGDEVSDDTFGDFQRQIHGASHQQEPANGRPAKPPSGGRRTS